MADTFYRWFSERKLTGAGASRRKRIEESRLALVMKYAQPPGEMLEIGPGHGSLARAAVAAGWKYRGVEASRVLAEELTREGQLTTASTFRPFTVYLVVAAIYFAMCFPLTVWSRRLEGRLRVAR